MQLATSTTIAANPGSTPGPASAALASGRLGARIVRLAQVAAAVHAAELARRAHESQVREGGR